jgi:hypothetical protein
MKESESEVLCTDSTALLKTQPEGPPLLRCRRPLIARITIT